MHARLLQKTFYIQQGCQWSTLLHDRFKINGSKLHENTPTENFFLLMIFTANF